MIQPRKKWLPLGAFIAAATISLASAVSGGEGNDAKFASERRPHKFLGATQVVLTKFNGMDKELKSAFLQLDGNEMIFSAFGDSRVTVVFYKPFEVKLTRLEIADPTGQKRKIFSVELPKEQMKVLGKHSLRLVFPVGGKNQPAGVRLLLVDPSGKVADTVELRPARMEV